MTEGEIMIEKIKKKLGPGSLSIVLALLGILFGVSFQGGFCIGDYILNSVGLRAWSSGSNVGTHLTLFYSLLLFIPAFLIGHKYKNDFGAKAGTSISLALGIMLILIFLLYAAA
jgi:hypothetical protein